MISLHQWRKKRRLLREAGGMDPNQGMGNMGGMPGDTGDNPSGGMTNMGGDEPDADVVQQPQTGKDVPQEKIDEDLSTIWKVVGGVSFTANAGMKRDLNTKVQATLDHWAKNEFQKEGFEELDTAQQYKGLVELIKVAILLGAPKYRSGTLKGSTNKLGNLQRSAEGGGGMNNNTPSLSTMSR